MPLSTAQLTQLEALESAVSTAIVNVENAEVAGLETAVTALVTAQAALTTFTSQLTPDAPSAALKMGVVPVETLTVGTPIKPIPLSASGGTGVYTGYNVGGLCPGLEITGSLAAGFAVTGTPVDNPATDATNANSMTFTVTDSSGATASGPLVVWTLVDPTVTPPPPPVVSNFLPVVPVGTSVPQALVKDWEFATMASGSSSTLPKDWSATWFGNGSKQNGTSMSASRVAVVNGTGVTFTLGTDGVGGIMSTNPNDGQHASGTGVALQPTAANAVYVEADLGLPATAAGKLADWVEWWLNGQVWPEDGEIDVGETLTGVLMAHTQWGSGSTNQGGLGGGNFTTPGKCIAGVLWTVTGVTFYYNGAEIWTHAYASAAETTAMVAPKYIILGISLPISAGVDLAEPATLTCSYIRAWQGPSSPIVSAAERVLSEANDLATA